ncbi:MAG: histidine--tRNA ligase [Actinobacteria bacterium]|jgi:histidyl-tRNA synthetase|nr:histidine--tRNA ligase [Actinomycetota bacterium]
MGEAISAPKGTYDILPEDQPLRRWVVAQAEMVFQHYGYRRIDTPTFEETKLFSRGVGESTDIVRKEMYTFEDLGGRSMTLRPEGTAPVARAYVEHGMHTLAQPVKLYYHSPMFRYESPQSGRYRQHYQLGVEAFGSVAPEIDAEVIGVLAASYRAVGLAGLELRLNSMGCRDCRRVYSSALRSFLAEQAASFCGECRERARLNPLRTFDCKVQACREALAAAPRLTDHLCPECSKHHQRVKECLDMQGIPFITDHTLVRGMDYYTRTTFEFQSPVLGAQSGVGGGGRYDDLVEAIGGRPVPGVGFGTGVERIILALSRSGGEALAPMSPVAYIVAMCEEARTEVFALAHEMRSLGAAIDLDYMQRSGKGQMKQAGRSGARYALIVGPQELAERTVTVRDLASGDERTVKRAQAVALGAEA